MRIRATAAIAAVSGALALTGAALPAQAATPGGAHGLVQALHRALESQAGGVPSAGRAAAAARPADSGLPNDLDIQFSNLKVANGAAGVAVGTTNTVHVPYTFTAIATNVDMSPQNLLVIVAIYHGNDTDTDGFSTGDAPADCAVKGSTTDTDGNVTTTASCKGTVDIHPADGEIYSAQSGPNYHVGIAAADLSTTDGSDDDPPAMTVVEGMHSPAIMRYSRITVHAASKSLKKGRTTSVSGALTRANWDTGKYSGYTLQSVKLQFRKKTSNTYTTVKTLKTDSHGNVKYTVKPTTNGYWRYSFSGTPTTPTVTAAGTYIGVK